MNTTSSLHALIDLARWPDDDITYPDPSGHTSFREAAHQAVDELSPRSKVRAEQPTPGELRVIRELAVDGAKNAVLAERLNVSPRTVGIHLQNAMGKVRVHTRTALLLHAVRAGWLDGDSPVAEESA